MKNMQIHARDILDTGGLLGLYCSDIQFPSFQSVLRYQIFYVHDGDS